MAGKTSIQVKESQQELEQRLRKTQSSREKERLQVLYWLRQKNAPSIVAIAKALGKNRGTVQTWLSRYRKQGIDSMLEIPMSRGGARVIPQWAEKALAKRLLESNNGFSSYGAVQQWLLETLGIEAEYHTVYQMTRYRLKAKLKVARPINSRQKLEQRLAFKKT